MPNMASTRIIGHLGRDPEIRTIPSGASFASFSVAVTKKERTTWYRVSAWGKLGEIALQYLKKGDPVYIDGSFEIRTFEDKTGKERFSAEIDARELTLLKGRAESDEPRAVQQALPVTEAPRDRRPATLDDDDIPF